MDIDGKNTPGDHLPNLTHLIRSIQRIDGEPDCFATAIGDCNRPDCAWHNLCEKRTRQVFPGGNNGNPQA